MIRTQPDLLIITMSTTEPNEKRCWLIKALAASLRWKATATNLTPVDEQYQEEIATLIESLATDR